LRSTPNTSVADNPNSETSSETGKANGKTSTKLNEALEEGHLRGDCGWSINMCAKNPG